MRNNAQPDLNPFLCGLKGYLDQRNTYPISKGDHVCFRILYDEPQPVDAYCEEHIMNLPTVTSVEYISCEKGNEILDRINSSKKESRRIEREYKKELDKVQTSTSKRIMIILEELL